MHMSFSFLPFILVAGAAVCFAWMMARGRLRLDLHRSHGDLDQLHTTIAEVRSELDATRSELETVRGELVEVHERLDFTERLLARTSDVAPPEQ